jgi:ribulose-phosphate 3-epimerase
MRELAGDGPVLEVDGGIGAETARTCAEAGAKLFVAGSAVFGADDPGRAVQEIADAIGSPGRSH